MINKLITFLTALVLFNLLTAINTQDAFGSFLVWRPPELKAQFGDTGHSLHSLK